MRPIRHTVPALLLLFTLLAGCSDLFGNGGEDQPPGVVSMDPSPSSGEVSVLSPISIEFSKGVAETGLASAVSLWAGTRSIQAGVSLTDRFRTVVLEPTDPLDFGTTYRVEVSASLSFRNGETLNTAESLEFSTEGLEPPSIALDSMVFHLERLAHDTMRGRGSGSPDEAKAAVYLKDHFLAYGLVEPPGGAIQPFQAYSRRLDSILDSRNVLAAVAGAGDLAQEWVVIGAHYDHIGFRGLDTEDQGPNNGADDNGSGTVMILEIARVFKSYVDAGGMASRSRRSVLFAAFGAEEQGLLGSCNYVHVAPAVPLDQTRAMMNFDMVGRLRGNTVYLSGNETSSRWQPMVTNSNQSDLSLAIRTPSCTGCTDHVCFWQAGVPFVGFFTGLHDEYHRPEDDADLINYPGMVRIGDLALRVLSRLVVMPEPPALTGVYPTSG